MANSIIKKTKKKLVLMNREIKAHRPDLAQLSGWRGIWLRGSLLYCLIRYKALYKEYLEYHYDELNHRGRSEYLTAGLRDRYCAKQRKSEMMERFKDKYKTYELLREYFHRQVWKISSEEDLKTLDQVAGKNAYYIVKPLDKRGGKGIIRLKSDELLSQKNRIVNSVPCVIEEGIRQADEMAKIHSASVNTVRFATYARNGRVTPIYATIRMGCGDSVVDNLSAGGISASIDLETGIVRTVGHREDGTDFAIHPDSGIPIVGMQIPHWNECRELAEKLALSVPEMNFMGWDLARDEAQWVLIEGNSRPGLIGVQTSENKGIRERFERCIREELSGPWLAQSRRAGSARRDQIRYGISEEEYLLYRFHRLNRTGKRKYVPDGEKTDESLICDPGQVDVQEQDPDMAAFCQECLNTVCLNTVRNSETGETRVAYAFIRMGRTAQTGAAVESKLLAGVDPRSGLVQTLGINDQGETCIFHPDSGRQIPGYRIPRWNELMKLAQENGKEKELTPLLAGEYVLMRDGWKAVQFDGRWKLKEIQTTERKGIREAYYQAVREAGL